MWPTLQAFDDWERKQREAELEQFFSLSQDLFASCGFDGYFRRANPAFTRTLGFSSAELPLAGTPQVGERG